jgi:hypothetical protein
MNMTGPDPEVMAAIDRGNNVVFFDMALGDGESAADLGRIKMELFVNDVSLSHHINHAVVVVVVVVEAAEININNNNNNKFLVLALQNKTIGCVLYAHTLVLYISTSLSYFT